MVKPCLVIVASFGGAATNSPTKALMPPFMLVLLAGRDQSATSSANEARPDRHSCAAFGLDETEPKQRTPE